MGVLGDEVTYENLEIFGTKYQIRSRYNMCKLNPSPKNKIVSE